MNATKSEWVHFVNGDIWKDLHRAIEERLQSARDDLETAAIIDVPKLQGRCQELQFLKELPILIAKGEYDNGE